MSAIQIPETWEYLDNDKNPTLRFKHRFIKILAMAMPTEILREGVERLKFIGDETRNAIRTSKSPHYVLRYPSSFIGDPASYEEQHRHDKTDFFSVRKNQEKDPRSWIAKNIRGITRCGWPVIRNPKGQYLEYCVWHSGEDMHRKNQKSHQKELQKEYQQRVEELHKTLKKIESKLQNKPSEELLQKLEKAQKEMQNEIQEKLKNIERIERFLNDPYEPDYDYRTNFCCVDDSSNWAVWLAEDVIGPPVCFDLCYIEEEKWRKRKSSKRFKKHVIG